jgi:hypothetical protein
MNYDQARALQSQYARKVRSGVEVVIMTGSTDDGEVYEVVARGRISSVSNVETGDPHTTYTLKVGNTEVLKTRHRDHIDLFVGLNGWQAT